MFMLHFLNLQFDVKAYPAGNYLFKVNHRNTRTRCEICSKLTIKTPERRHSFVLVSLLLTLNKFTPCSSVSIVNLEQVNAHWDNNALRYWRAFRIFRGQGSKL